VLQGSGKMRAAVATTGTGLVGGEDCSLVEHGLVRFYYRPRLPPTQSAEPGANAAVNAEEVPRLYLLLLPGATEDSASFDDQCRSGRKRLLVVGQKAVAGTGIGSSLAKTACFIAAVTEDMEEINKNFVPTHGPSAEPCGDGSYVIARLEGMTYLTYAVRLPSEPIPTLREDFVLSKCGSYLLAVKNPQFPSSSSNVRLPKSRFSRELQAHFGDNRRWAPLVDPAFMDYVGAELILLGVSARFDEEDLGEAGAELRGDLLRVQSEGGLLSDVPALMTRLGKPLPNRNPIC